MEKKLIAASVPLKRAIAKTFEVGERTVRNALTYRSNSDLARRIRKFALDKGGELYVRQAPGAYDS